MRTGEIKSAYHAKDMTYLPSESRGILYEPF